MKKHDQMAQDALDAARAKMDKAPGHEKAVAKKHKAMKNSAAATAHMRGGY